MKIARDVGLYAYQKATKLSKEIASMEDTWPPDDQKVTTSTNMLRYALIAGRMLRRYGKEDLASKLPIQIHGTIREMVFYFYQTKGVQNYEKSLRYAEQWLELVPNDLEIMLYQARCYRNYRDPGSLSNALKIIAQIEERDHRGYLAARLEREKAIIAETSGRREDAETHFRKGIKRSKGRYSENHVGLAQLFLREVSEIAYYDENLDKYAASRIGEAVKLLKEAREHDRTFDRFHLGLYVEALIMTGEDDVAADLIASALHERPNDERLNYAMGEIHRKAGEYDKAITYAQQACDGGAQKAHLSLANSLYGKGMEMQNQGSSEEEVRKIIGKALEVLEEFRPVYGEDKEIQNAIRCKMYRSLGKWEKAMKSIASYGASTNSYTVYEMSKCDMHEIDEKEANGMYTEAMQQIDIVRARIENMADRGKVTGEREGLLQEAGERGDKIMAYIGQA
jgi:tetratricopeptide (TPR) repeat protein